MPYFSWARASYVMFGVAVFAALIKLWSPDVSSPKSFAAETRTDNEASPLFGGTKTLDTERRKPPELKSTIPDREQYVRHTLDIPDEKELPVREPETSASGDEPPVFYRPESGDPGDDRPSESAPVCGDLGDFLASSSIVFPLQDDYFYSYEDTWGAPRPQGGHEGTDLMAPSGAPEYAITDGTVVPVSGSNNEGWNTLGGYAVMVRADYDVGPVREGDLFYYAHMEKKSALKVGSKVRAGQIVGYSGDTGQGPEVTRGLFPPHLHLGWYDGGGDRGDLESGAMNPYPLLEWLKRNGGSVVGGSGAEYCEAPRNEETTPAETENQSAPAPPGKNPDLDTGTKNSRPSSGTTNSSDAARVEAVRTRKDEVNNHSSATRERNKKLRANSRETRNVERDSPLDRQAPTPREAQRYTGRPHHPARHNAPVDRAPKEPETTTSEQRTVTRPTTRENKNTLRATQTSPEKAENNHPVEPETKQKLKPARPDPQATQAKNGCDAAECSKPPGDPEASEGQTEETNPTPPSSETTAVESVEKTNSRESTPEEGVGTPTGSDTTSTS